ncbi:MAG: HIG1 domain-containing protein [Geminicoccaceae bacterium]|nr:HIG1 domain-containing protein [Geminicoccaceae bacterium]MCX8100389.1 HIG1 domain-containing protein [Geminicoccaceae bacterium]MDW8369489.1 HIG1 domain-containing protein [Geminicoccaceae bacterium]
MNTLIVLLFAFMAATALVLLVGIGGFVAGGRFNDRFGNKLMQARVGLQLVAVVLLGLLLAAHG